MEVTVSARHTDVPERLRLAAEDKVGRLARYVEGMDRAEVHFTTLSNPRIAEREQCEVTMEGHGHFVRAKVAAVDGHTAVDKAVAKLERQLRKLKTKLQNQKKGAGKGRAAPVEGTAALASDAAVLDATRPRPHFSRRSSLERQLRVWTNDALSAALDRLQAAVADSRKRYDLQATIAKRALLAISMMAAER